MNDYDTTDRLYDLENTKRQLAIAVRSAARRVEDLKNETAQAEFQFDLLVSEYADTLRKLSDLAAEMKA